jgi:hypothetical protein
MENNISKKLVASLETRADKEVMYICEHHLDNREHWTPLIYNRDLDKMICPKCNAQYGIFSGVQVLWTRELEQKAINYAQNIVGPYGKVIKEKTMEFTHDTPLEQAPVKPEPPKSFEQLLHDFIMNWKATHPMNDGHDHSRSSKVLFDLYSAKAQVGWTDFQIKQYFGIPINKNFI